MTLLVNIFTTMHRFFLREGDIVDEKVFVIISEELLNQWTKVLRFRIGEKVILFQHDGKEYVGEIMSISPKIVQGNVMSVRVCDTELPVKIILAQSILKNPDKFESILQKGTELGISAFYPLITKRTERESLNKFDRLQRIILEATEQSGRVHVPVLHEPVKFEKLFLIPEIAQSQILIPHFENSGNISESYHDEKFVTFCIGPEGGFLDQEVAFACEKGALPVGLGKRILRSETAALAAVAQLAGRLE